MIPSKSSFVEHLNGLVTSSGLSNAELSRRSGIAYTTLLRKLAGRGDFTVAEVLKLARALGMSASELIPKAVAG